MKIGNSGRSRLSWAAAEATIAMHVRFAPKPTHGHHSKPPLFAHLVSGAESPAVRVAAFEHPVTPMPVATGSFRACRVRLPGSGQWY